MKKFLMFLCAMFLVFFVASSSYAIVFTDTEDVGALYGADINGVIHQGDGAVLYEWEFTTPSGFQVPFDTVNSARVDVEVGWVDTFGDDHFLAVGNSFQFMTLDQNTAIYELDVAVFFLSWDSGDTLLCSLIIDESLADGDTWGGDIILGDSTFTLDYTNVTPVPEPSTILLMGAGLLGLVGYNRKRFSKKS